MIHVSHACASSRHAQSIECAYITASKHASCIDCGFLERDDLEDSAMTSGAYTQFMPQTCSAWMVGTVYSTSFMLGISFVISPGCGDLQHRPWA